MTRKTAARWSREPSKKGLARVCQSPRGLVLKRAGIVLLRIGAHHSRRTGAAYRDFLWHWYGFNRNSAAEGREFDTLEEAKADALKELAGVINE
jgi:hypothetical protein